MLKNEERKEACPQPCFVKKFSDKTLMGRGKVMRRVDRHTAVLKRR